MRWYEKITARRRNWGISNLMGYISVSMFIVFCAQLILQLPLTSYLALDMNAVFQGQVWRLVTFIFMPSTNSLVFIVFSSLFYWYLGQSLESQWGKTVLNLYYLIGVLGTIISALFTGYATNTYLNLSLFLAFAYLFPDTYVRIYFVLPIKVKYMGYVYGGFLLISAISSLITAIVTGHWSTFASIIASVLNFILFFSLDIYNDINRKIQNRRRRKKYERNLRNGTNF